MHEHEFCRVRLAVVVAIAVAGCVPSVQTNTVRGNPVAKPGAKPIVSRETKPGPDELTANVAGDEVVVKAVRRERCRVVAATPTRASLQVTRELTGGSSSYVWNSIFAGTLLASGGAVAFSKCETTEPATDTAPELTRPCTGDEAATQRTAGYVLMGTALVPVALMAVNAVREKDDEERWVDASPARAEGAWGECGEGVPAGGLPITFKLGSETLKATTDSSGTARFSLGSLDPNPSAAKSPVGVVRSEAGGPVQVGLAEHPIIQAWRAKFDAEDAERKRSAAEAAAERERQENERQARLSAWRDACERARPDVEACYSLGMDADGVNKYLRTACVAGHAAACAEAQMRQEAGARAQRERAMARAIDAQQERAEAARDPKARAWANVVYDCIAQNGLSAEGQCKIYANEDPSYRGLIRRQCVSLCLGDQMGDKYSCESRCQD